ncbi:hypothetical protein BIV25_26145 [Streptomyces sp. MUSC 14]|uniref:hypothetical protein n=1 Tax=Streptomyces sp. MUSC 14 TaxID=1354889 RepID=UPI0008F5BC57|nr:hypothetical protein [Streptomyces sp. MUSC 14]OIJ92848.1 hypothetical protein BIV25_26145 [Streptomyces sp. MUSC 14]
MQRQVLLSHVSREAAAGHLDHIDARVEIVTGTDRARIRRLSAEADDCTNAVHPQDRLSRCPHLKRIAREFRGEGGRFDRRRVVVCRPHPGAAPWPTSPVPQPARPTLPGRRSSAKPVLRKACTL